MDGYLWSFGLTVPWTFGTSVGVRVVSIITNGADTEQADILLYIEWIISIRLE